MEVAKSIAKPSPKPPVRSEKEAFFSFGNDTAVEKPFFQPKLSINTPGDVFEQEADAMAEKVMNHEPVLDRHSPVVAPVTPVQAKCAECEEEEERVQKKEIEPFDNSFDGDASGTPDDITPPVDPLNIQRASASFIPSASKSSFFSVNQNTATPAPFFQTKLAINTPGDVYEQEADTMAEKVMSHKPVADAQPLEVNPVVSVQAKCAECEEEEDKVQKKEIEPSDRNFDVDASITPKKITQAADPFNIQSASAPFNSSKVKNFDFSFNQNTSSPAPFFQTKVASNTPGNIFKQEADAISEKVMSPQPIVASQPSIADTMIPVQLKCAECEQEEDTVQMKEAENTATSFDGDASATPDDISNIADHSLLQRKLTPLNKRVDNTSGFSFGYTGPSIQLFFQPKLSFNQRNDACEQEADAVAERIMRMSIPEKNLTFFQPKSLPVNFVQKKCTTCESEEKLQRKDEEEEEQSAQINPVDGLFIQTKCAHCEEAEEQLHRKESGSDIPNVPPAVEQALQSSGQPIETSTRSFMEQRFGYDFGNVRIHNDTVANKSSKDINALAYTHGQHVVFGSGQYRPDEYKGKKLLAHELSHVLQQTRPVRLRSILPLLSLPAARNEVQRCKLESDCSTADVISNPGPIEVDVQYPDNDCKASSPDDEDFIPASDTTPLFNRSFSGCNLCVQDVAEEITDDKPDAKKAQGPCEIVYPEQTPIVPSNPVHDDTDSSENVSLEEPSKTSVEKPHIRFFPKDKPLKKNRYFPKGPSMTEYEWDIKIDSDQLMLNDTGEIDFGNGNFVEESSIYNLVTMSETIFKNINEFSVSTPVPDKAPSEISSSFISDIARRMNDFVGEGIRLQNYIDTSSSSEKNSVSQFIDKEYQDTETFFDQLLKSSKSLKQSSKAQLRGNYQSSFKKLDKDYNVVLGVIEGIQTDDAQSIRNDLDLRLAELSEVYQQISATMQTAGINSGKRAIKRAEKWYGIYSYGSGFGQVVKDKILGEETDGLVEGVELTKRKFSARANITDKVGSEFYWGIRLQTEEASNRLSCSCPGQEEGIKDAHSKTAANLMCFQELAYRNLGDSMVQNYNLAESLRLQSLQAVEEAWKETDSQLGMIREKHLSVLINSRDKMLANIDDNAAQLKSNISQGVVGGVSVLLENLDNLAGWQSSGSMPSQVKVEEIVQLFYQAIDSGKSDIFKIYAHFDKGLHNNTRRFIQSVKSRMTGSRPACVSLNEKYAGHNENIIEHSATIFEKINEDALEEFNNWRKVYEPPMRQLRPALTIQVRKSIALLNEKLCGLLIKTEAGLQNVLTNKGPFDKSMICAAQKAADAEVEAYRKGFRYLKYVVIGAIMGIAIILSGGLAAISAVGFFAISGIVLGMALIGAASAALIRIVGNISNGRPIREGVLVDAGVGAITGLFGGVGGFVFKGGTMASIIGSMSFDIGGGIIADLIAGNEISLEGILLGAAIGFGVGVAFTKFSSYFPRSERLERFFNKLEGKLNRGGGRPVSNPDMPPISSNQDLSTNKNQIDGVESAEKKAMVGSPAIEPVDTTTPDITSTTFDTPSLTKHPKEIVTDAISSNGERPGQEVLNDIVNDIDPLIKKINDPDKIKEVTQTELSERFDVEVELGKHTFRRDKNTQKWCRFSTDPICQLDFPHEVNTEVDRALKFKDPVLEAVERWNEGKITKEELLEEYTLRGEFIERVTEPGFGHLDRSRRIKAEWESATGLTVPDGYDLHHVIPENVKGEKADRLRELLEQSGIGIHDFDNLVPLPTRGEMGNEAFTHHRVLHGKYEDSYLEDMLKILELSPDIGQSLSDIRRALRENRPFSTILSHMEGG